MAKIIKRVNSTGRRRISREDVTVEILNGPPRSFTASFDLSRYNFPGKATVVLDVLSAGSVMFKRYTFGTIAQFQTPDCSLADIAAENVFFTLKVIDQTERFGRILGVAENIRPANAGKETTPGKRGLLPVEPAELGDELWKLEFRAEGVFLLVNKTVPDFSAQFNTPRFAALLYPAMIRSILERAIRENADETDDRWPNLWLLFGKKCHPEHESPPELDSNGGIDSETLDGWLDDVVSGFSRNFALKRKYLEAESLEEVEE